MYQTHIQLDQVLRLLSEIKKNMEFRTGMDHNGISALVSLVEAREKIRTVKLLIDKRDASGESQGSNQLSDGENKCC